MRSFREFLAERQESINELKIEKNIPFGDVFKNLQRDKKIESYSVSSSRIGYLGGNIIVKNIKSPEELKKLIETEANKYFKSRNAKSIKMTIKIKPNGYQDGVYTYDINWHAPIDKEY